ncbi:hypothetical protein GIB67_003677 [Kingdonia uniflora]|uniref:Uncharacterized protein n=1 Tax=Kingdonia uniflora TaxID=39325 RepID=A0A7J7M3U0_9MAGN|nr:hypothetical protein GIB67_003677 [Kingdonia uniflora]
MTNSPPNNSNNKKNGRNNNENNTLSVPQALPRTIAMRNIPIPSVGGIVIRETPSNEVSTTTAIEVPNLISTLVREGLSRVLTQRARREPERQLRESGHTGSPAPQTFDNFVETIVHTRATISHAPENITKIEFPLPLPPDSMTTLEEPHRMTEVTNLLCPVGHTNSVLSKRVIVQRVRRERERQLREFVTVSELFNQEPSNHTLHTNVLNTGINRVPMHTELPISQALDSVAESEVPTPVTTVIDTFREQSYHTTEALNLQNLTIRTNSNFPSSIFEIGESLTARENVTHYYVEEKYNLSEADEDEHVNANEADLQLGHHFLGQMDILCIHCSALYWRDERLTVSSISNPRFGQCCLQANAFISLGVTMDDPAIPGRGPSSFVIHGELHHRISALLPNQGQEAMYAQLYIYIPSAALHTRQRRNPHLRRDVLKIIEDTLLQSNPFCELYHRAYEVLEDAAGEDENFNVPALKKIGSVETNDEYRTATATHKQSTTATELQAAAVENEKQAAVATELQAAAVDT